MFDEEYEIDSLWHLHDTLTVTDAAALIAGYDPGYVSRCENDTNFEGRFSRLHPARSALVNAITARKLAANLRYDAEPRYVAGIDNLHQRSYWGKEDVLEVTGRDGESYVVDPEPNWRKTTVALGDLRDWLSGRGIKSGFFFPDAIDTPDYLDQSSPRYAPKLAAAVSAWQAVSDPGGKHPKQALTKWLREHASKYGLADDDGKPNETGIEEVAKVANWRQSGGAPKTPGE